MKDSKIQLSLEEIRKAQKVITIEMAVKDLTQDEQYNLEQSTLHLRNLERVMVASVEKDLIDALKQETTSLKALTEHMNQTSKRLYKLAEILRKVVKITGQVIDVLQVVG
jgi:DNA polymerase II large subunit